MPKQDQFFRKRTKFTFFVEYDISIDIIPEAGHLSDNNYLTLPNLSFEFKCDGGYL